MRERKKLKGLKRIILQLVIYTLTSSFSFLSAQNNSENFSTEVSLTDCIKYALKNQPLIKQAQLGEEIARQDVKIAFSDWLPQVNGNANLQHNIQLPTAYFPNLTDPTGPKRLVQTGVHYNSGIQFSASQAIFNNDVFLAARTAKYYKLNASQNLTSTQIDLVVNVSKAFYDAFLAKQQLNLIQEDIARLNRNLKDAMNQYKSGVSDKIDYERASIALNNAIAERKTAEESIKTKYAYLKQLMGFPPDQNLFISYDSAAMAKDIIIDTTEELHINNRIEYQLLRTQLVIQKATVNYYKWGLIPSISAYGDYNIIYQNDKFSDLYSKQFPNSDIGLRLSIPILQGSRRIHNIKRANLVYEQMALDTVTQKNQFNTEYIQALAAYKSNLAAYRLTDENVKTAKEVNDLVKKQYNSGIKTYLDVIVSETDLRTAEINNLNALFMVLSGKLDIQRALGDVQINY